MQRAYNCSSQNRVGSTVIQNKDLLHLINDVKIAFKGKKVENPLFHAIKLVEKDELEVKDHEDLVEMVDEFKKTFKDDTFGDDFEAIIADDRYQYISKNYSSVLTKNSDDEVKDGKTIKMSKSDKIDRVLTHRVFGLLIFAAILFLVFHLTFS